MRLSVNDFVRLCLAMSTTCTILYTLALEKKGLNTDFILVIFINHSLILPILPICPKHQIPQTSFEDHKYFQ